ncbi:hypothetical protein E1267_00020 [Nonomuraea longispora]|uniref:Tyr recombinase domain-containing protein n=1 Tax=Nonomuraea longispora TaxID=1848320 RepID=A0A4R4NQ29_9ACTN|nr:tyrosine-type recombinase/integrase [Nonomuraea longispora]TDC11379.1 hypothetical protein E1267_00020 [Nonomuraea longispora]
MAAGYPPTTCRTIDPTMPPPVAAAPAAIHTARWHATASLMFAQGADLKAIQGVFRHSRQSTTADVYTHFLDEIRRGTADNVDSVAT